MKRKKEFEILLSGFLLITSIVMSSIFIFSVQQVINFHSSESSYFSCHFSIAMPFFVILIEYFFDGNLKSLWRNLVTQWDFFSEIFDVFFYSFWYWNFHWLDTMWLEKLAYLTIVGFVWETIHGSEALKYGGFRLGFFRGISKELLGSLCMSLSGD
jgi:hypothetical protein